MLIFITGFMGVGKTTIGKQVAELLNIPFLDLDEEIENQEQKSISQIFKENGEDYFRQAERSLLESVIKSKKETTIIALGGGTMCHLSNHLLILQNGIAVYLKTSWEEIEKEINLLQNRPKLSNTDVHQVYQLFRQREPIYALSQLETLANTSFDPKKLANRLKLLTNR